jgi:hypothetical protein
MFVEHSVEGRRYALRALAGAEWTSMTDHATGISIQISLHVIYRHKYQIVRETGRVGMLDMVFVTHTNKGL